MKDGIKFIVSYSVLSICLFAISKLFFKELTSEIFSYLIFYYIITISIGVILYPILSWLLDKYKLSLIFKLTCSFIFCLIVINIIPFFYDNGRILFIDAVTGIFKNHSMLGFNNLGVHLVAIISFTVCYLLYRRDNFWVNE